MYILLTENAWNTFFSSQLIFKIFEFQFRVSGFYVYVCTYETDAKLTLANVVKPTSVSWEQRATSNILKGEREIERGEQRVTQ